MSWSVKIATVRGIPIRVHASFLLILLWAAWIGLTQPRGGSAAGSVGFMVLFTLLLFICVVLHELGHSLVAQVFGVKVHDITLWPIGGVARLSNMPRRPAHEFLISAAGPLVNIVLALMLGVLAVGWIGPSELLRTFTTGRGLVRLLGGQSGQSLVLLLALQNVLLVLFNLIPAFPMDGGRLLRSFLAGFLPFRTATRTASFIGQGVALVLFGISFIPPGNLFLTLIATFVFLAAWQERSQVMALESLAGLIVRDAMQPLGARLSCSEPVQDALRRLAAVPQSAFVVVEGSRLAGIMTRGDLLLAARTAKPGESIGQHVPKNIPQIGPDEPLVSAQERLQTERVAVVVDNGVIAGLITRSDIARLTDALEMLQDGRARSTRPR
ncbi:MAG: M50 family metallopeptidase [Nitrososphaerales archaeon]